MGKFVQKLIVHISGARQVRRDPGVSANLATHGEAMAQRANAVLRAMGNRYVRVHVVQSNGKTRARARVMLSYPAGENLESVLLNVMR